MFFASKWMSRAHTHTHRIKIEMAKNRILTIWCNDTNIYEQRHKYRLQMKVCSTIRYKFGFRGIESNGDWNSTRSEEMGRKWKQYDKGKMNNGSNMRLKMKIQWNMKNKSVLDVIWYGKWDFTVWKKKIMNNRFFSWQNNNKKEKNTGKHGKWTCDICKTDS